MIRLAALLLLLTTPALAQTPAKVLHVIDGDTLVVAIEIAPWDGVSQTRTVRLRGIDAAEMKGKCPAEIAKAKEAKAQLTALVAQGGITLHDVGRDKFGRLLARVEAKGVDVAATMLALGHARAYGGEARKGWC